jgi:hypothetical protein
VLARPPLKLINPRRKPLVQRGQLLDLPGQLSDQPVRPASRTASPAASSADSCSAEGRPGTADTTGNDHHSSPPISNAPRRVSPGGAMILRAMIALMARHLSATAH